MAPDFENDPHIGNLDTGISQSKSPHGSEDMGA